MRSYQNLRLKTHNYWQVGVEIPSSAPFCSLEFVLGRFRASAAISSNVCMSFFSMRAFHADGD
jgi:hypothetical protein